MVQEAQKKEAEHIDFGYFCSEIGGSINELLKTDREGKITPTFGIYEGKKNISITQALQQNPKSCIS